MMKWIKRIIWGLILGVSVMMSQISCNAAFYFDDAKNYLVYDTGNHAGQAADLSSAVIVKNNPDVMVIAVLSYEVWYNSHTREGPITTYFMKMKKSQCYYWKDKLDGEDNEWFEFTDDSFSREAYCIIESKAIDNTYNKGNS